MAHKVGQMTEPAPKWACGPCGKLPTHAKGLMLHMSDRSSTGYKKVYYRPENELMYVPEDENAQPLGRFATAVAAAVCYARYVAGDVSFHARTAHSILDCDNRPGTLRRWLVRWEGSSAADATWEPRRSVPKAMIDAYEEVQQVAHNLTIEPTLLEAAGVLPCAVESADADACAAYLGEHWRAGSLPLSQTRVRGYSSYEKTIDEQARRARHTAHRRTALRPGRTNNVRCQAAPRSHALSRALTRSHALSRRRTVAGPRRCAACLVRAGQCDIRARILLCRPSPTIRAAAPLLRRIRRSLSLIHI
eukprot:1408428-Prymnesium_polylepis.1